MTTKKTAPLTILAVALLSILFVNASASAQELGLKGIGGTLAYLDPKGDLKASPALEVTADLGSLAPRLYVDAALAIWSSKDAGLSGRNYSVYLTDYALLANLKYHLTEGVLEPYLGGGVGYHNYSYKVRDNNLAYSVSTPTLDSQLGIHLLGGLEYTFSPNMLGHVEIRSDFNNVSASSMRAGLTYLFAQ